MKPKFLVNRISFMTQSSSSSRRRTAGANSETSNLPTIPAIDVVPAGPSHTELSDVTAGLGIPDIPELDVPVSTAPAAGGARRGRGAYINPFMALLRKLKRQPSAEITEPEMEKLNAFLSDDPEERLTNPHLVQTFSAFAYEIYERYSRSALTLAIYLGKTQGNGVTAAKNSLRQATGITIGEADGINGFPKHNALRYTAQELVDALEYLALAYGDDGSVVPGALTAANAELAAKNEAAGRPSRYQRSY